MPESMHMIMCLMSDRGLPRSLRMIEGFGVHTFRLVDAAGISRFVKFHWRPVLVAQSVVWDEAMKINGADQDFHRRDLWSAIDRGDFPEWELSLQVFDEAFAASFGLDVLDATKLIPEEQVPLRPVGRMVLDRNPDNFFAETEQVAFHPGNLPPGIDVSADPLLQGRLFSYIDTQLFRSGGPNFHEIPINQPNCPMRNFQRDGLKRHEVPRGRVSYEPNSLDPDGPRANPERDFVHLPVLTDGAKTRFELEKVETLAIWTRMLGHLAIIDDTLVAGVEEALGMEGQADMIEPARLPIDLPLSPMLSIIAKAPVTMRHRVVGALVSEGCEGELVARPQAAIEKVRRTVASGSASRRCEGPGDLRRLAVVGVTRAEVEVASSHRGSCRVPSDAARKRLLGRPPRSYDWGGKARPSDPIGLMRFIPLWCRNAWRRKGNDMDIIDALKEQHKKVKAMFEQLESTTTSTSKTRFEVLAELESGLRNQMKYEEEVLYPEVKAAADKEWRELTKEAFADHEITITTLNRLKEESTGDEMWKAWLGAFKAGLEHHIMEEGRELFVHVKAGISAERRTEMAAEFKQMNASGDPNPGGAIPGIQPGKAVYCVGSSAVAHASGPFRSKPAGSPRRARSAS